MVKCDIRTKPCTLSLKMFMWEFAFNHKSWLLFWSLWSMVISGPGNRNNLRCLVWGLGRDISLCEWLRGNDATIRGNYGSSCWQSPWLFWLSPRDFLDRGLEIGVGKMAFVRYGPRHENLAIAFFLSAKVTFHLCCGHNDHWIELSGPACIPYTFKRGSQWKPAKTLYMRQRGV